MIHGRTQGQRVSGLTWRSVHAWVYVDAGCAPPAARYIQRMDPDRELMRLHIATLFTHDERGRLVRVNVPGGGPAPRFYLGRTRHGCEWRVRGDLDHQLIDELAALCTLEATDVDDFAPPEMPTPFEAVLARSSPVQKIWMGPAYYAGSEVRPMPGAVAVTLENAEILRAHLPSWVSGVSDERPMFAATVNGDAVAVCSTVRRTSAAVQAGVETVPDFRGRGYGSTVVAAWADAVRRSGATPLYSTSWENVASRALARSLGLTLFGADLHLT